MRNEGSGFAANIYGAMPESSGDSDTGKRIFNIRGSQPRLASLDSPFQRKGRECGAFCTCQQKLDTKLKNLGIKIEYLYKIQ